MGIANTLFVLLAIGGGFVVMTHETIQSRYSVKEVAPRLVFAVIAVNASLAIAGQAIAFSNALAGSFLGAGLDPNSAVGGIGGVIGNAVGAGGVLILLSVMATVLSLGLVCVYLIRAALVVLLVAAAPLALACHALPQTEGLAALWWRAAVACFAVQIGQAIVLIASVRVFFSSSGTDAVGISTGDALVSLLMVICLFWIMLRIPVWAGRMVFDRSNRSVKVITNKVITIAKAVS